MSLLDRMLASVAGTIDEIKEARGAATAELLGQRTTLKLLEARAAELAGEPAVWEGRASQAILAGDDDLARAALRRRDETRAELARLRAEHAELSGYAAELLRGRRELDAALQRLELRQGTVAAGLAAARSGGASPFATEGGAFERLDEAGRRIDEDAIVAEMTEIDAAELASQKIADLRTTADADDALAELKRKMKLPP